MTHEQVEALIAKFKAARVACNKAQTKVRDIAGRQPPECIAKACDEHDAAWDRYEDAAIQLALAVAYHRQP